MGVQHCLTDKRDGDPDCAEKHGLSSPDSIEDKYHEYKVGKRANAVVYPYDKGVAISCDAKCVVHDRLVICDYVDPCHLGEDLNSNTVPINVSLLSSVEIEKGKGRKKTDTEHTADEYAILE